MFYKPLNLFIICNHWHVLLISDGYFMSYLNIRCVKHCFLITTTF